MHCVSLPSPYRCYLRLASRALRLWLWLVVLLWTCGSLLTFTATATATANANTNTNANDNVNAKVHTADRLWNSSKVAPGIAPPLPASSRHRNVTLGMGCPELFLAFRAAPVSSAVPFRTFSLIKGAGYAYVALHFPHLWLPRGASIVLRAVESVDMPDRVLNLTHARFPSGRRHRNVDAPPLLAKELRIELYRDVNISSEDRYCFGFVVDGYDYALLDNTHNITPSKEATCINDNSKEAVCYYDDSSTRTEYLAARAVARLRIQKEDNTTSACTGWLVGNQGHLLTNHHCVNTAAQAANTIVEFMADAASCAQSCTTWGGCPGTVEAISTTLVRANAELDYALLKLSTAVDLYKTYGFLRLKATPGRVSQEIYIPQHPLFYGKRIAMFNDYNTKTTIISTNTTGCDAAGYAYNGDTQAGSSGAPVLDAQDHGVVALHHCGQFCANTGIPSTTIIADLNASGVLPNGAVDSGDNTNTNNFPSWQPPAVVAPRTLVPKLTYDGVIQRDAANPQRVSVDQFKFSLNDDADVSFDVLSTEVSDDGKFRDLNGDCRASYVDAIVFLFRAGDSNVVLVNDDDKARNGARDGSISMRDPYARTFLKAGDYVLAVAAMPATAADAFQGFVTLGIDAPEIYTCAKHSQVGSYRIQLASSTDKMTVTQQPPAAAMPPTCGQEASVICAF